MSDKTSNILDSLKEELEAKRVIPFIGAGVSRSIEKKVKDSTKTFNPLFPNWKEFLDLASKKLHGEKNPTAAEDIIHLLKLSKPKYLEAAQIAHDSLRTPLWNKLLKEIFEVDEDKASAKSLELAQLVWQLGSNLVFTTNIDEVLEWKAVKDEKIIILDTQTDEFPELQREEIIKPTLVYLHGRIRDKANIVFTLEQYKDFYDRQKNTAKLETLRSFLARKTFLFIGFSLDDPYFVEQLEYIHKTYNGASDFFYVLVRKEEKGKLNHLNYIKEIEFEKFGAPLLEIMREMRDIVDKANKSKRDDAPPPRPTGEAIKTHFNVPFESKGDAFVGRQGLREEIWKLLNSSGRAAIGQAVSIKGIGGLGKTQLAVEYANKFRDRYKNGVFWLTADEDINNQLIKIGEDLSWISQSDTGFDQAELVRNRFRKLSGCLIIFDNVDEQNPIEDYLPERDARPHILITSREKQSGFYQIELELLERNEARDLLLNVAKRTPTNKTEEEALVKILEELEDLPLAVELVGGYLSEHPTITFEKYYKFLQDVPLDKLEAEFPDDNFTKHDKSIIRTLKISEKLLEKKPLMVAILDILAWSGKSFMGISLLRQLVETDDEFTFENALSEAVKLRLIKKEEKVERYAIHRLLARVRRFEKPLSGRKEWHQKIVKNLVKWFRKRKDEFEFLTEFEAEIIHLQQWQSQSVDILPIETVYLTDFESYPLWHRGNYGESEILLEKALDLYKENQLDDNKLLAHLYNDLAIINGNLGNIQKDFEFQKKALLIGRKVFDEKSEDIGKFLHNLSGTYRNLGNYKKALEVQQQALKIRKDLFSGAHVDIANSLSDMGQTYSELGEFSNAIELQQQALEIRQKLFNNNHPDIADSMSNIGLVYNELGDYNKAIKLQQQALEMRRKLFNDKHPSIASSLGGIGLSYVESGNFKKAIELQQEALEILRELFGDKHPSIANSLNTLGGTYSYLGDNQRALKYKQQALEMDLEFLGDKHPGTATSLSNLGLTYGYLGNYSKALELQQQALEIRRESFGEKHPSIANSLANLGGAYRNLSNYEKSVEKFVEALEIFRETLGNRHSHTIKACSNLISDLVKLGFREKAGRLAGEFLSYVPPNHPDRKFFEKYGMAYRKAKQRKKKRRH